MKRLDHFWYSQNGVALALAPLSGLFCQLVRLRRACYRRGWLRTVRFPVPVIIIGNITVGGSGKTPLVLWIADFLRQQGYRPGIVSRGYGGRARQWPQLVSGSSEARQVGDEPLLLARRSGCPVVVGPDRPAAVRMLLERFDCDVVLGDDGMQHYRLGRDVEIAVLDGKRRLGNGRCLPGGPLREPASRLMEVDLQVANGNALGDEFPMRLVALTGRNLADGRVRDLADFAGGKVHAVAGIGDPSRFFDMLRGRGLDVIEHPFADHHPFTPRDLDFGDGLPVLMTEKDGVKCLPFAEPRYWEVAVTAELPEAFGLHLLERLRQKRKNDG